MADNKLSDMIKSSLESIGTIADSSTVIGDPIPTNNGTLIIPVSKITVGYASGGLDYLPKNKDGKKKEVAQNKLNTACFGGGGGTGVSVTPVCFLVVNADGKVTMLNINNASTVPAAVGVIDSISSFADKAPDIVNKFKNLFGNKETEKGLDDDELKKDIEELKEDAEK